MNGGRVEDIAIRGRAFCAKDWEEAKHVREYVAASRIDYLLFVDGRGNNAKLVSRFSSQELPMVIHPKRRTDVTTRDINGEILILDRKNEDVHQLNSSASYVWQNCDGQVSVRDIAVAMAKDFSIDFEVAEKDVNELIGKLRALGLLESD